MMEKIGAYTVTLEIGRGGSSTVYLGHDPNHERIVAIKLLDADLSDNPDARRRFRREVAVVTRLNHPAIVPVIDFGQDDGRLYVVMAYMPGGSLRDRLADGPLDLLECCEIIDRIAGALAWAHAEGVIHRDLKPHNILLDGDGQAMLSDFGVARLVNPAEIGAREQTVTLIGTPEFMAPEQATNGAITPQTDIYQLGVTLFQLLTAQRPFQGSSLQIISQHLTEPVPSAQTLRSELPDGIDEFLRRAMAKDPNARFASVEAFRDALWQLQAAAAASTQLFDSAALAVGPEIGDAIDAVPRLAQPQVGASGSKAVAMALSKPASVVVGHFSRAMVGVSGPLERL